MVSEKRIPLLVEIKKRFGTQRNLCLKGPFRYDRLSSILNDWKSPTLEEVSKLSQILKKEPSDLFPELQEVCPWRSR